LEEIINQVNTYNVNTIFYEELVSPEISKKIADETGVKTETLNPLEGLEQEDLDAGEDYLSIMRDNLAKIKEANK
jgi:zinc transport system substrate-binding protein